MSSTVGGVSSTPVAVDSSYGAYELEGESIELTQKVEPDLQAPDPATFWRHSGDGLESSPVPASSGAVAPPLVQPQPSGASGPDAPSATADSDSSSSAADQLPSRLGNLTDAEKKLRSENPVEFLRMIEAGVLAVTHAKLLFPDQAEDGQIGNAFQHALWSALMTRSMGEDRARAWGNAHESHSEGERIDQESAMDLHNNNVGRQIGAILGPDAGFDEIVQAVLSARNDLIVDRP